MLTHLLFVEHMQAKKQCGVIVTKHPMPWRLPIRLALQIIHPLKES